MPEDAPNWPDDDPSLAALPAPVRARAAWVARLFWLVPLTLYAWTSMRGPGWIDGSLILHKVYTLKTSSWVNSHDLFHYLARLWTFVVPIRDFAWSLNLFCGVLGALTVHLLFLLGLRLTHNLAASVLGAVALMLSHSLWWHSVTLEVYTLNTAMIATMLLAVAVWDRTGDLSYLFGALACLGLGITNHVLMGLYVFAFLALFAVRPKRDQLWRTGVVLAGVGMVLLGSQQWIHVFLEDTNHALRTSTRGAGAETFQSVVDAGRYTLRRATGGKFQESMFPDDLTWKSAVLWRLNYLFTLAMNFPSVAFPLGLVGGWAMWTKRYAWPALVTFFAVGLVAQATWSANYLIWDMYAFGLPVWVMFGLLVMLGADHVWRWGPRARKALALTAPTLLLPLWLYPSIAHWSGERGFWSWYFASQRASANLYDGAAYFANPSKRHERGAMDLIEGYALVLPPNAHIWDDDAKGHFPFALYGQRTMGIRRDVKVHDLFGAFLSADKTMAEATEMKELVDVGEPVFVSSLRFPERRLLMWLWKEQDPNVRVRDLSAMSEERFIADIPDYRIERVPLDADGSTWIYRVSSRGRNAQAPTAVLKLEAETLKGARRPAHGMVLREADPELYSEDRILKWVDGNPGDTLTIQLESRRAHSDAELRLGLAKLPDGAEVVWRFDDHPWTPFDGWAEEPTPAQEVLLYRGPLDLGSHTLEVRIEASREGALPGQAVGVDYVRIRTFDADF